MASKGGIGIFMALTDPDREKDLLETPLEEKNFIQEGYKKNPSPFWIWLAIAAAFVTLAWGTNAWLTKNSSTPDVSSSFLQVTNREFSLFLTQFPEYAKSFAKKKGEFLPAFSFEGAISVAPTKADEQVIAPVELLFLYHTWKRQVGEHMPMRSVPAPLFLQFLQEMQMWQPRFWKQAPASYQAIVRSLEQGGQVKAEMLLDKATLPQEVLQAFQAWRNTALESKQIAAFTVSKGVVQKFLNTYPHYARNYWQNVLYESHPRYLRSFPPGKAAVAIADEQPIADEELAPFLRFALYNFTEGSQSL